MSDDADMWRSEMLTKNEPIDPKQIGVDAKYSLDAHYELVFPGTYHIDPPTGLKVWSEPALVLVVSVTNSDWARDDSHALHYGLTRSLWGSRPSPGAADQAKLMTAAKPLIKAHIAQLGTPQVPSSLPKTRFL